ncbi:MAG: D-alanine--D-alanine ligase [Thermoleophilia bacterium]|nr:D-alanine--D-alanine ligase [Thermoleophilia bacterium]
MLCGGRSHERAVSLRSGARVEEALGHLGHEAVLIDTGPDASKRRKEGGFTFAFVALHGRGGEDGTVQSLLELLGIPYTGSRGGPSESAFDKARAKRIFSAAGVPTPKFLTLTQTALEEFGAADALDEARDAIGFPLVVKPARGGSAMGVRFVNDERSLPRALISAMSYDREVVVEQHVTGRELAVAVLGSGATDSAPGTVRVLPPVEIVPRNADWFDYESRYEHGETEFTCPPQDMSAELLDRVSDVALRAYEALDCSGLARVDLLLDEASGIPWVLEVSPVPGLTTTSIVPLACEAAGTTFEAVIEELLADAIAQGAGATD